MRDIWANVTSATNPWLGSALLVIACGGCGGSGSPYDYHPVYGKVTYEDGSPIPVPGLKLRFTALDAPQVQGMKPRPAQASVGADGGFSAVTSHKFGDGLIPGKHRVTLMYATDKAGKLVVPENCTIATQSPLVVDTADAPLEIKVPKP